jgi:hypothetical protein
MHATQLESLKANCMENHDFLIAKGMMNESVNTEYRDAYSFDGLYSFVHSNNRERCLICDLKQKIGYHDGRPCMHCSFCESVTSIQHAAHAFNNQELNIKAAYRRVQTIFGELDMRCVVCDSGSRDGEICANGLCFDCGRGEILVCTPKCTKFDRNNIYMAVVACKFCFKLIDGKEQHGLMNGTMSKCSTKRRLCCLFHRHSLLRQISFQDYINDTYHSKTSFFKRVELAFKNITVTPTEEMATKGKELLVPVCLPIEARQMVTDTDEQISRD